MKLRNLFLTAAATLTLSLGAAFSANAALVKQTFDLSFDGASATLEIGALTEKSDPGFDDAFVWINGAFEFVNISGFSLPGVAAPMDFSFDGSDFGDSITFFDASAFLDSVSGAAGDNNGFFQIFLEFDIAEFVAGATGTAEIIIYNDAQGTEFAVEVFGDDGLIDIIGLGDITVGAVEVSSPAAVLLMALSIGGLLLTRRK